VAGSVRCFQRGVYVDTKRRESSAKSFWEAGILPLNYARKRRLLLQHCRRVVRRFLRQASRETYARGVYHMRKSGPIKRKRAFPSARSRRPRASAGTCRFVTQTPARALVAAFGIRGNCREPEARVAYHRWLAEYLENGPSNPQPKHPRRDAHSGPVCQASIRIEKSFQPASCTSRPGSLCPRGPRKATRRAPTTRHYREGGL
jgi:hypothetical protein